MWEVELMRGEGRVGRVEEEEEEALETDAVAIGAHMELMTDTLVVREGVWHVRGGSW